MRARKSQRMITNPKFRGEVVMAFPLVPSFFFA
jgi:hypothetical protein